jgi:hypothetical protein
LRNTSPLSNGKTQKIDRRAESTERQKFNAVRNLNRPDKLAQDAVGWTRNLKRRAKDGRRVKKQKNSIR